MQIRFVHEYCIWYQCLHCFALYYMNICFHDSLWRTLPLLLYLLLWRSVSHLSFSLSMTYYFFLLICYCCYYDSKNYLFSISVYPPVAMAKHRTKQHRDPDRRQEQNNHILFQSYWSKCKYKQMVMFVGMLDFVTVALN